jgi:RNA polymerase sigma factor (sigma-70 family)
MFEEAYSQYRAFLILLAREYFNHHRARCIELGVTVEDLEQQSFFALRDAIAAFDPERGYSFLSWLRYPSKNRFNELVKLRTPSQKRDTTLQTTSLDEPLPDTDGRLTIADTVADPAAEEAFEAADDRIYTAQLRELLEKAISTMPGTQRTVMELHFLHGLSRSEAADACGIALGTADIHIKNGLERLRQSVILKRGLSPILG